MTKKLIYVILIVMIASFGLTLLHNEVYAESVDGVVSGAQSFLDSGTSDQVKTDDLKNTSNFVFNAFLAVAIVVAVVIGMIIGIQFMMAGVDEKAKLKEALIPYVAGCIVVFGAFGIWKLAVTVMQGW